MLISTPPRSPASSGSAWLSRGKRAVARLLHRSRLLALAGNLRRAMRGPRYLVLCYHRISGNPGLPALSAAPEEFARQAAWFAGRFDVLPLESVADYLAGRLRLRRDTLSLTFDDGYADNYHAALPILRRHGLPATFFIASEPLLLRRPYWYDVLWSRLEDWNGAALPGNLCAGMPMRFQDAWQAFADSPDRSRRQAVLNAARSLDASSREAVLAALAGRRKPGKRDPDCATMTLEEARLAVSQGISMGGHSLTHPSLASLPADECRSEIVSSLADLAAHGLEARHFAYPFGAPADVGGPRGFPRSVLAELRESGAVGVAVTTDERALRPGDDPLLVPRKVITPQSLPQIALKLEMLAWQA